VVVVVVVSADPSSTESDLEPRESIVVVVVVVVAVVVSSDPSSKESDVEPGESQILHVFLQCLFM